MTDVVMSSAPSVTASIRWPAPVALAISEGVRVLRHPVSLGTMALWLYFLVTEPADGPSRAFQALIQLPTWFYGVGIYFAANLVASRDRRADSGELLAAAPVRVRARVAAHCLAGLVPALLTATVVLVAWAVMHAQGYLEEQPTVWQVAQPALTVLGAALLGTMIARWLPYPGAAAIVMVGMFAANMWLNSHEDYHLLGTYVEWALWSSDGSWHGFRTGSSAWHALYLVALCGMAAAGALLSTSRRRLPLLLAGGVFTAVAAVAGVVQLP